jgi:hypothetical protein
MIHNDLKRNGINKINSYTFNTSNNNNLRETEQNNKFCSLGRF